MLGGAGGGANDPELLHESHLTSQISDSSGAIFSAGVFAVCRVGCTFAAAAVYLGGTGFVLALVCEEGRGGFYRGRYSSFCNHTVLGLRTGLGMDSTMRCFLARLSCTVPMRLSSRMLFADTTPNLSFLQNTLLQGEPQSLLSARQPLVECPLLPYYLLSLLPGFHEFLVQLLGTVPLRPRLLPQSWRIRPSYRQFHTSPALSG